MKQVQLTKDKYALVDDEDYEFISQWRWYCSSYGYAQSETTQNGKRVRRMMHRFLMNAQQGHIIDHINGDRLDNRRANLRFVTHAQNSMNKVGFSSSGYKGVHWSKTSKFFHVHIQVNGIQKYVGISRDAKEAAQMYNDAAIKYQGPYARLNLID